MLDDPKETPVTNTPVVDVLINTLVDSADEYTKKAAKTAVKRVTAMKLTKKPTKKIAAKGKSKKKKALKNKSKKKRL